MGNGESGVHLGSALEPAVEEFNWPEGNATILCQIMAGNTAVAYVSNIAPAN